MTTSSCGFCCMACCLVCHYLEIYTDTEHRERVFVCRHPKGYTIEDPYNEVCIYFDPHKDLKAEEANE